MGGEPGQLPSNYDSSEGLFSCGAGCDHDCASCITYMPESGALTENLLAFDGTKHEGLIERIQLENKLLHEKTEQHREDAREKIKSYRPGDGIHEVGGVCRAGFVIPKVTTLLVVGSAGAGKSCLINNMIRVLDNVTTGARAQTYGDTGNGSLFLQEYYLYKNSKHFCVFDSRGFSRRNASEDLDVIKKWMSIGICHGEAVSRPSDTKMTREAFEGRGRQCHSDCSIRRNVNFVIFVVNAFTINRMRESHDVAALENLALLYKSPFLSFMDDVPVVVMTHGDKLTPQERVLMRIFIGELLGVSPVDQVFDISCFTESTTQSGDVDMVSDLVLLNMLKFALERADKNLPYNAAAAAFFQSKIHTLLRYRWRGLGIHHLLVILNMFWLFSVIFIITLHKLRSNKGLTKLVDEDIWKIHKKLRHGCHKQYRF